MYGGNLFGAILSTFYDMFIGNIFRFLRHIVMPKEDRGHVSHGFVITLLVLLAYGLVVLFSASYATGYAKTGDLYQYIRPQLFVAAIGLVVMYVVSYMDYRALQYAHWPLYLITILLLIWALFSDSYNSAHRWIFVFGSITVQPSEIAKFSAILCVASYTAKHYSKRNTLTHGILIPLLPLLVYMLLLALEPHHSAMVLIAAIVFTMLVCGGCGLRWMAVVVPTLGVAGWMFLTNEKNSWASERMTSWGLFAADTSKLGWQMQQSVYSIASGGLTGLGLGNSRQKHQWLPESVNDFIFSILCEELGFIGGMICMLLFAFFIVQGILIALRAPDFFGSMVAIGITAQIAWQIFFHIGTVTGATPNTGISLPFFSAGGTSLLLLLAQMGVMLSISRAGNANLARREKQTAKRQVYVRRRQAVNG